MTIEFIQLYGKHHVFQEPRCLQRSSCPKINLQYFVHFIRVKIPLSAAVLLR